MGRTAKPRKAYRPRPVDASPHELAMARATALQPQQRQALGQPLQQALEGLRTGQGGWDAWRTMADALNVAEQLARAGIASDRLPEILEAQAALHALHQRHAERGTWTLRASELAALTFGAELHAIQLRYASQGEMADAIRAVQRRVQQALQGNAPKGAMVCGALGVQAA